MDYFNFEVFVHALEFADPAFVEATAGPALSGDFPSACPYAVAFNLLDYPILLVYAKQPMLDTSAAWPPPPVDLIDFQSGKACMLQADAEELQFLVEQVRRHRLPNPAYEQTQRATARESFGT